MLCVFVFFLYRSMATVQTSSLQKCYLKTLGLKSRRNVPLSFVAALFSISIFDFTKYFQICNKLELRPQTPHLLAHLI